MFLVAFLILSTYKITQKNMIWQLITPSDLSLTTQQEGNTGVNFGPRSKHFSSFSMGEGVPIAKNSNSATTPFSLQYKKYSQCNIDGSMTVDMGTGQKFFIFGLYAYPFV